MDYETLKDLLEGMREPDFASFKRLGISLQVDDKINGKGTLINKILNVEKAGKEWENCGPGKYIAHRFDSVKWFEGNHSLELYEEGIVVVRDLWHKDIFQGMFSWLGDSGLIDEGKILYNPKDLYPFPLEVERAIITTPGRDNLPDYFNDFIKKAKQYDLKVYKVILPSPVIKADYAD